MAESLVPLTKLTETLTNLYPKHVWRLEVTSMAFVYMDDIAFIQIPHRRDDGCIPENLYDAILNHILHHLEGYQ